MMRTSIRLTLTLATALLAGSALLACGSGDEFTDADAEQAMLATFEEINKVPRCSKDEARISAWLADWARARGFAVTTDAQDNVLITCRPRPDGKRGRRSCCRRIWTWCA
jgi:hypothetical protein